MTDHFLPELEVAMIDVKVNIFQKFKLARMFTGMIMKIIYAFQWQEFFFPRPFMYTAVPHFFGAWTLPMFNFKASLISGIPQTDKYMNWSKNLYPGDKFCRRTSPHAFWHEESANGLVEIVFMTDFINSILSKNI